MLEGCPNRDDHGQLRFRSGALGKSATQEILKSWGKDGISRGDCVVPEEKA